MGLFSKSDLEKINAAAKKSQQLAEPKKSVSSKSINTELRQISENVKEYFKDSKAELIVSVEQLHDYITEFINAGIGGIDTETTGLDRMKDHIVGVCLYYPGGVEVYIPSKHIVPLFDTPYSNQLTYEQIGVELQRLVDAKTKLIFANADFDLSFIYKDLKVDLIENCFFDVIIAWRCLKENERDNSLKGLYAKYPLKGKGDPMKFRDFFSPALFPYCKPDIAKLYAANDAKITYELFLWQLPFLKKDNPKCKRNHLEAVSDLVWGVEFPMIAICQRMHRRGIYLEQSAADMLKRKYLPQCDEEHRKLRRMVQELIDDPKYSASAKPPFSSSNEFNPNSVSHVKWLCYDLLKLDGGKKGGTGKEILGTFNLPVTNQILKCRSLVTLIGTFVEKLPNSTSEDSRIHCEFKQMGASTGRMSCISRGTLIEVLNGRKPIEDIEPDDMVYCYDDNGGLHLAKVKNKWLTGHRKCVKVKWQSSGNGRIGELICTPEHPIRMKDGSWVHAEDLKRYQKMAHLHRIQGNGDENRPKFTGWNGLEVREQDLIREQIFGVDNSYVIHHKNGIKDDNRLENLEVMLKSQHTKMHTDELMQQERLKLFKPKSVTVEELELLLIEAEGNTRNVKMSMDTFKKKCRELNFDYIEVCKRIGARAYRNMPTLKEFVAAYGELHGDKIAIMNRFNISEYKYNAYLHTCDISTNHMVQSVTYAGEFDVYDIEVEGYHNFIANEICVHNSAEPNMQNIPSRAKDIRHMFRATPGYVMLSSDYSQQEPKLTAYVSQDPNMIKSFQENKDIYSFIAAIAFNKTYEECKEFTPTGEYNPEGKARRTEAKSVVLGILYGRSIPSIADQLYSHESWSDEKKIKQAQYVYDSVLNAFPALREFMINSQEFAKKNGYVQTILGRRRHIPDMKLPDFEFQPMPGYVNPYVDPLDISTFDGGNEIPQKIQDALYKELTSYKYFGQVAKRIKQLAENDKIKVINNRYKISEATRQVVNSIIQGSAADLTKLAMLKVENDPKWNAMGGRVLVPVHDELIAEVPIENWKEGGERLSQLMCDAASFLPFSIKCDVTTTYRWNDLEYPCPYKKPESIHNLTDESEINWVLYHLFEIGYELPVFKGPNGEKPEGNAALGISGIMSETAESHIQDYCNRYHITEDEFIIHIQTKVHTGHAPNKTLEVKL